MPLFIIPVMFILDTRGNHIDMAASRLHKTFRHWREDDLQSFWLCTATRWTNGSNGCCGLSQERGNGIS